MRLQLGVFGGSQTQEPAVLAAARSLGRLIAEHGHILVTGGAKGVSHAAGEGAGMASGQILCVIPNSPWAAPAMPGIALTGSELVLASGMGYRGRNLLAVRSCAGAFFLSGGPGTLSEAAIALAEDIPICTLRSSGGIAEHLLAIAEWIGKDRNVVSADEPAVGLQSLLALIDQVRQSRD